MPKINSFARVGAVLLAAALASTAFAPRAAVSAAGTGSGYADQLEMLEWSDPERAAQLIDAAPRLTEDASAEEIDIREIRGII